MSFIGNQNVFRFELTVYNPLFMQKLHRKHNLCDHVTNCILSEDDVLLFGVEVEVSFRKVLHHNIDVLFVLEDFNNVGEKGVVTNLGN